MKFIFPILAIAFSMETLPTIHSVPVTTMAGDTINLSRFHGKKLLIVNTASYCGYTPQFADLQVLYDRYKASGFEIIGFPSNDFGKQDPGTNDEILHFCTSNYHVTFPMMSKVAIVNGDTSPVYKWLQRKDLNGVSDAQVKWNFNKFLIDEEGRWVAHYGSRVKPLDTLITGWITERAGQAD
jgi:glutathione peroxidase